MKILQGGAPKCGNFWLYQIIEQILSRTGKDTTSYIEQHPIADLAKTWDLNYPSQASIDVIDITDLQTSYRISSIFRKPVENMQKYVSKTNHVWTHSPICKRSEEVFSHFDKVVYIIRDPRERAISAARYYCSDYMLKYFPQEEKHPEKFLEKNFEKLIRDWVWHVFDHLRLSQKLNIHISFFERFLFDFKKELSELLSYLNLNLNKKEQEELTSAVSFNKLQKENPKHLRKGKAGTWTDVLTEEQKEISQVIAGPLMDFLNYNSQENQPVFKGFADFETLKQQIIASQKPLFRN